MANSEAIKFTKGELEQLNYLLFKVRAKYPGIEDIRCDGHKIWGYSVVVHTGEVKDHTDEHPSGGVGIQIY